MKITKLIVALSLIYTVAALNTTAAEMRITDRTFVKEDPKKTEIAPSELPEKVKNAIDKGEYAKWKIVKAYIITYSDDSEKVEYEVHFTNKKEKKDKQIIVYDKEGEVIVG